MAANDFIFGGVIRVNGGDGPYYNNDSVDLIPGIAVVMDTVGGLPDNAPNAPYIVRGGADGKGIGFALQTIKQGYVGPIQTAGVAVAIASGVVTRGDSVQLDTAGKVKTAGSAKPGIGIAQSSTAADGEPILVLISRSLNA